MAYLELILLVSEAKRGAANEVFRLYKPKFLKTINGATSAEIEIRPEDMRIVHGFDSLQSAIGYVYHELLTSHINKRLKPLAYEEIVIRIYTAALGAKQ
ncbi:TPA: hypothetical protein ACKQBZ_000225 [Stenotrophomonas maltophilia]|uniref:Uncharacterized protein n=1 Tax=Stenotrophomonas maltophilia TaxID=40324 RepID=A0AAJ2MV81_STEMA|nr:hypothetical protein [Stenotrophomonas maltophilia]MDT3468357.1 hypothetical protein [Stenotrophomonas maltophilia]